MQGFPKGHLIEEKIMRWFLVASRKNYENIQSSLTQSIQTAAHTLQLISWSPKDLICYGQIVLELPDSWVYKVLHVWLNQLGMYEPLCSRLGAFGNKVLWKFLKTWNFWKLAWTVVWCLPYLIVINYSITSCSSNDLKRSHAKDAVSS